MEKIAKGKIVISPRIKQSLTAYSKVLLEGLIKKGISKEFALFAAYLNTRMELLDRIIRIIEKGEINFAFNVSTYDGNEVVQLEKDKTHEHCFGGRDGNSLLLKISSPILGVDNPLIIMDLVRPMYEDFIKGGKDQSIGSFYGRYFIPPKEEEKLSDIPKAFGIVVEEDLSGKNTCAGEKITAQLILYKDIELTKIIAIIPLDLSGISFLVDA